MEHGDAIRMVQDLRAILDDKDRELESRGRQLVRKDALILKMKDRDLRRREERRQLQDELRRAKDNIGELNSTIVRLESTVEFVRRANNNQALTIAGQAQELTSLNRKLKVLDESLVQRTRERDCLLDRLEELEAIENQWPDDDAPNLALAACKKKMEQLEGMLEAQRRSTRELGVNLQRVRDEKAAMKADLKFQIERRDMWQKRAQGAEERAVDLQTQLSEAVDVDRRQERALSLIRQGINILYPVKVTEEWNGGTKIAWTQTPSGEGMTVTPQAKKATPKDLHQCAGINGSHRCNLHYLPGGSPRHQLDHHCHCGFLWPW